MLRPMTQLAPLRPLCLALHFSISSSTGRQRYLCLETNKDSTHIEGSTAWLRSRIIFSPSLKGGERASKVPHVLAPGQVSMEAKPQSNVKLTNWAQTEPSRPLCCPHHLHRFAAGRLLSAVAATQSRAGAFPRARALRRHWIIMQAPKTRTATKSERDAG